MDNNEFLELTDVIDWRHGRILALAAELGAGATDDESCARLTFEWVRDNVQHSVDFNRTEVTCRASDVLAERTGFCYAKSHLVAALMRANGIPTGVCYQRLSVHDDGPPYCLHGLNSVFLKSHGWYRIDARGNTETIHAKFLPPHERLAFEVTDSAEADLPEIWPVPLPIVVAALNTAQSVEELRHKLPDVLVINTRN